jgi:hypothetical protein
MEFRKYVQRASIPDLKNNVCNKEKGPLGPPPFDHKTVTNPPWLKQLGVIVFTDS